MTTALIFAAHLSERWDGDGPKQLFEINGVPILHRTVRQLTERQVMPIVVTNTTDLSVDGAGMILRARERWLVAEMVRSSYAWIPSNDMLFVLGDVCWTDDAMDTLCTTTGLRYLGRANYSGITGGCPEIFGAACSWSYQTEMMSALLAGYDHALLKDPEGKGYNYQCGTLWQTYRAAAGLPLDYPTTNVDDKVWLQVDDLTDDVDTLEHAERLAEVWAR